MCSVSRTSMPSKPWWTISNTNWTLIFYFEDMSKKGNMRTDIAKCIMDLVVNWSMQKKGTNRTMNWWKTPNIEVCTIWSTHFLKLLTTKCRNNCNRMPIRTTSTFRKTGREWCLIRCVTIHRKYSRSPKKTISMIM